jgi:spermidine synthase
MMQTRVLPAKTLSFILGLLSLSAETLWVRTATYFGESMPIAFTLILATYLVGIALGAVVGARLCAREADLNTALLVCLLGGSVVLLLSPAILASVSELVLRIQTGTRQLFEPRTLVGWPCIVVLSFLPAFIFSICFPICHHLGTSTAPGQVGKSMSRVYSANIAGSVLGPLLVNFGILQFATTQLAYALVGFAGILTAMALLAISEPNARRKAVATTCMTLAVLIVAVSAIPTNWFVSSITQRRFTDWSVPGQPTQLLVPRRIIETRQGIVVSFQDGKGDDIIYGGNVYDGRANLDPRVNSNGINRVLMLAAVKASPKRVLVIGLSVGTWLTLLTGFEGVEQIDVVEINPGYLRLIESYPDQKAALADPRIRLNIGDGRKFLRSALAGQYDLILMNTSWNWRAYSSMLLSKELIELARSRLSPGGLLSYNATGSPDALKTASTTCPHAYLYGSFVVCGETDWRGKLETPEAIERIMAIKPLGRRIFAEADRDLVRSFVSIDLTVDLAKVALAAGRPLEVITDRNLITEYRYGRLSKLMR